MDKLRPTIKDAVRELEARFLEREELIRIMLLGVLSGENVLLVGPPGTAKSQLARSVSALFGGVGWFEYLLTRFTTPDEVFGPVSLQELKKDRYVRQTEGYLPAAHFAFLDEIFKSGSAILNALLSLLNERVFHNGREKQSSPLQCLIAASNELPEDSEGLSALYDRFLIRYEVGFLQHMSSYERMFSLPAEPVPALLTLKDVREVRARSREVALPQELVYFLFELKNAAQNQGLTVTDRRWRKIGEVWRTSAALNGRAEVSVWDTVFTPHMIWDVPEQLPQIKEWFDGHFQDALLRSSEAELSLQSYKEATDRWKERKDELVGFQFKREMGGGGKQSGGGKPANRPAANEAMLEECRDELEDKALTLKRQLVRFHEKERGRAEELLRINVLLPEAGASAAKYVNVRIQGERILYEMMETYRALFDTEIPGVEYDFTL
jgi:MoxR-like ATPase